MPGLSGRPARSAAEHVPGLRLAARRLAHATHRERAVRLGLLRLRTDLHLAFLRREAHGGLRAVQFRDARHRQAVRGHPRGRVFKLADPDKYDAIVVINLCVPTASGVPLRLLPKEINGVRIIGIDVPGFGVPTHAEAKDVLAGAMLNFARHEAEQGPVQAPRAPRVGKADGDAARRNVPGRSCPDRRHARSSRPRGRTRRADARMARTLWRARLRRRRGDPSVLHRLRARVRARGPHGHRLGAGRASTARPPGSKRSARPAASRALAGRRGEGEAAAGDQGARSPRPRSRGRITLSGYEGSELIVGRLLVESGADLRYVGTACPRTRFSEADRDWLEAKGVMVQFRASLEHDLAAMAEFEPDLAIGTTPVVQTAKERVYSGALFHQSDLGASADGRRRRRIAGQGRQRGDRQQGPLRRNARLL